MEKLNELMSKACLASEMGKKGITVDLQMLSQIRDEFWAVEKRAEAAEAKLAELAELEKQDPVAWTDEQELRDVKNHGCGYLFTVDPVTPNADPRRIINLFTRAAPAINLAELVPDEMTIDSDTGTVTESGHVQAVKWWNACRAAILRNIEEKG